MPRANVAELSWMQVSISNYFHCDIQSNDTAQYDADGTQGTKTHSLFTTFTFRCNNIWPIFIHNLQQMPFGRPLIAVVVVVVKLRFFSLFSYAKKLSWVVHIHSQLTVILIFPHCYHGVEIQNWQENSSLRVCYFLLLLLAWHPFWSRKIHLFSSLSLRDWWIWNN